jgi:transposase-like protein
MISLVRNSEAVLISEIEVDETFIGGKARNMHKSRKARLTGRIDDDKSTVTRRQGSYRGHQKRRLKTTLHPLIKKHVEAGTALYTDSYGPYVGLSEYKHKIVDHAVEYVNGRVHTNTMENFWSLVKRGLHGTYVSVEPFHLYRYLDEQMFRFNNRKGLNDGQRFALAMTQIGAKRLTYAELTGKDESPRHETTRAGETQIPY